MKICSPKYNKFPQVSFNCQYSDIFLQFYHPCVKVQEAWSYITSLFINFGLKLDEFE